MSWREGEGREGAVSGVAAVSELARMEWVRGGGSGEGAGSFHMSVLP